MSRSIPWLTLDANIFVAALKQDEKYSDDCAKLLELAASDYRLVEPSVVFVEVLGTLARRLGSDVTGIARDNLCKFIDPVNVFDCDRGFCLGSYSLCEQYGVYAVDALYLESALRRNAVLVSLDREDFIDKVNAKSPPIRALHVSEFF